MEPIEQTRIKIIIGISLFVSFFLCSGITFASVSDCYTNDVDCWKRESVKEGQQISNEITQKQNELNIQRLQRSQAFITKNTNVVLDTKILDTKILVNPILSVKKAVKIKNKIKAKEFIINMCYEYSYNLYAKK